MIDREKVIKAYEDFVNGYECFCTSDDYEYEMHKAVLALLKEQEAVEPIPFITTTGEESKNYVVCGHCKSIKAIMPKDTKQKYCYECGRPVLWEGR